MDVLTKEQRRRNMQAIKSSGTKIELILSKALWHKGYRYRKNCKNIYGKPDIVFRKYKLAIFCDSEFWHGKNFNKTIKRIGTNKKFWYDKIKNNIARDKKVNKHLKNEGWTLLRFWEKDIVKNIGYCTKKVETTIQNTQTGTL